MRCGHSVRPGAETRGGEVMGTGPGWHPFVPPGSELQQEIPETPAAADPSPEHLIAAVLAKVSESPGDPRVPTPAFQVIHVIRVADSIVIAFMQPELGNATLIYAMDIPRDVTAAPLIEAIITENFLDDLRMYGTQGWNGRMLQRIGERLFIVLR